MTLALFPLQRYVIGYLFLVTLTSCTIILPINAAGTKEGVHKFKKTTIANLQPDAGAVWVIACSLVNA